MLAWLFDPVESHGLGDAFLKRLWILLKAEYPDEKDLPDVIEVEAATFDEVEIQREWADRKTRDRLDLLAVLSLRGGEKWVLAIEVKVTALQGENQLNRYREKVNAEYSDARRRAYVFLTRDGEEPQEGSAFLGMDFGLIHRVLKECLDERGDLVAPGPKNLMDEYLRLLETQFMPDNDIQKLARQIYREHREALDLILKYRQDFVRVVSDKLEAPLTAVLKGLQFQVLKVTKGNTYLLPELWDKPGNKNDKGTAHLYCLLDFYYGKTVLRVVLEGGNEEFRNRMIAAAPSPLFKRQSKRKPGELWTTLHVENLGVEVNEEAFADEESAAKELIEKTKAALESFGMKKRIETLAPLLAALAGNAGRGQTVDQQRYVNGSMRLSHPERG